VRASENSTARASAAAAVVVVVVNLQRERFFGLLIF
jgi:hypothetical protein